MVSPQGVDSNQNDVGASPGSNNPGRLRPDRKGIDDEADDNGGQNQDERAECS